MEMKHTKDELRLWQALPLNIKVSMTKERIRQWVNEFGTDGVCVSFSGGKDSTALLHIVRSIYPNIIAVFSNTGLEYPEIQKFVRGFDNTEVIRPAMMFRDVILKYGYPIIGKEVAEAIYYARKIRGGEKQQTKGENLWGTGQPYLDRHSEKSKNCPHREDARKWKDYPRRCLNPNKESQEDRETFWNTKRNRGSEWEDWRRGCL